jgi:hypothetical protein
MASKSTYNLNNNAISNTRDNKKTQKIDSDSVKIKIINTMPGIFNKIITRNVHEKKSMKTKFDCTSKINISLQNYILRLVKYTNVESNTLIHTLALIDKICTKKVFLSYKNVHKVFLVALIISIKLLEDEIYADSHYAYAGGISIDELAEIESEFLTLIDYRVIVDDDRFIVYYDSFI